MEVTIKDIASALALSRTTISFILNGRAEEMKISPKTVERVIAKAKEMGYEKNYLARALSTGKSMTVGLVMNLRTSNRMFSLIAQGVQLGAIKHGYDMLVMGASREGEKAFVRGFHALKTGRIDAMVTLEHVPDKDLPNGVVWKNQPIVSIAWVNEKPFPCVDLDPTPGISEALHHLKDLGHHRVIYLGKKAKKTRPQMIKREKAYKDIATSLALDLDVQYLESEGLYFEDLEKHISHNLNEIALNFKLGKATAILCLNDLVALALYRHLESNGLSIPNDVSVIGFDDMLAAQAIPAMTTISHCFVEIGEKAVDMCLNMSSLGSRLSKANFPSRLIIRASTGPAKILV